MTGIIYARYSSDNQREESIDGQIRECKEFADKLESNENILMFTKLKKGGFVIDTPYGNYSPDWAIICRKDGVEKPELGIYFIVETIINKDNDALTQVEVNKIKCGQLHFKVVSDLVKFDWVKSYEDFKAKFGVKENEVCFVLAIIIKALKILFSSTLFFMCM